MRKPIFILGVILGAVLVGILILFTYLKINSNSIQDRLLSVVNERLNVPISVQSLEIDVVKNFPNISLRLENVLIEDPLKSENSDTLLFCEKLYAEFGLFSVLKGETILRSISAFEGELNLRWDKNGVNNYSILKKDSSNSNSYINLKELTLMNTAITINGLKESELHHHFIAKRIKISGVLDKSDINAKASWEVFVPDWNDQKVFISGSTEFYSNSNTDSIEIKNGELELNDWKLKLDGSIANQKGVWSVSGSGLDMSQLIGLLPKELMPSPETFRADGDLDLELRINTNISGTHLKAEGHWTNGFINADNSYFIGDDIKADIIYDNGRLSSKESSSLIIKNITCKSRGSSLGGNLRLDNFISPECKASIKFDSKFMDLIHWLEYPTWKGSSGSLNGQIEWQQNFKDFKELVNNGLWGGKWSGTVSIPNATLEIEGAETSTEISEVSTLLNGHDMDILDGTIQTATTKARVRGVIQNLFNDKHEHYELQITGSEWNIEDILDWTIWNANFTGRNSESFESGYDVIVAADRLTYEKFIGTDCSFRVKGKGLDAKTNDFFIRHSGGTVSSIIEWRPLKKNQSQLRFNNVLKKINLKNILQSFDNFDQNYITDKNISGILNAQMKLRLDLDSNMEILNEKIIADVDFSIKKGRIIGFEPLKELWRFSEIDELNDVQFGTVRNRIRISDKVIIIPEMTLENNAVTLKINGKHGFDNYIDFLIKMQLKDIVGGKKRNRSKALDQFIMEEKTNEKVWIPIKVIGPSGNLKFNIDTKKIGEEVKSTLKNDWKQQGEDLKNIFQKTEEIKKETQGYEFEWEEEPDTNRLFNRSDRSINNL